MSWAMFASLFGVTPKTVDVDPLGNSRIWSSPGILAGKVSPSGQVTGAGGEVLGTIRTDLFGDLSVRSMDGSELGHAHVDAAGRDHWTASGEDLGYSQESVTGLDVFDSSGVQVAVEQSVLDHVAIVDPQGLPLSDSFDLTPELTGFDPGGLDLSAMDLSSMDVGGIEFSAFDSSVFDVGQIDLGVFAGGIDPGVFDAIDF